MADEITLELERLLRDCPEERYAFDLARPISHRLDRLIRLAEDAGERTSRKEMVAALILRAAESETEPRKALQAVRQKRVRDTVPKEAQGEDTYSFSKSRPGPRGR
jgi:hypothetical protein